MPKTGWDGASSDLGAIPGREVGQARGGIICVSTFQDVTDMDAVDDALGPVLCTVPEVVERGGAFPTYPHFPKL